jgi:hypothetical protein
VAICCLNITLNGGKLLLRGIEQQQQFAIQRRGSDGGDHARLYRDRSFGCPRSICPHLHVTHTQDRSIAGLNCTVDCSGYDAGYKWAKQRDIEDDDYCPDGNKSFYEGCAAYAVDFANETDSGIGTPRPLSNDDDNDDDTLR